MSKPIIEVNDLAKCYRLGAIGATSLREEVSRYWDRLRGVARPNPREFWALRGVSFSVQPGEVVGVIGRNGAGKSTLLKIISRITEPTSGRAVLRGRVASLLEVGTGFHPELSGRENIYLNGAILGMTRAEVRRKFDEIVAFAEVDQFIDTPVKRYSSGMYVRLAFAVAAHLDPEILIVDEVLAVGDAQFQKKCLGKMQDVARGQGRTVLFVSHNLLAVRSLCHSAVLLVAGRLVCAGAASETIAAYERSSNAAGQSQTWQPASPLIQSGVALTGVNVAAIDAAPVATVDASWEIEVRARNERAGAVLNASVSVIAAGGVCVFNSYSTPAPMPAGELVFRCLIPGGLLNDETYTLSAMLVEDGSRPLLRVSETAQFTVAEGARIGAWHGKHEGLVRPRLAWTVRQSSP